MTPLPTPLAFSLILVLLLIDGASAWHTEIRDHDMLAFGRRATVAANNKREKYLHQLHTHHNHNHARGIYYIQQDHPMILNILIRLT
jgi:hypothetical protein